MRQILIGECARTPNSRLPFVFCRQTGGTPGGSDNSGNGSGDNPGTEVASTAVATAHDFSSALDSFAHSAAVDHGVVVHDTGLFHAEHGTVVPHEVPSISAFSHQLFI